MLTSDRTGLLTIDGNNDDKKAMGLDKQNNNFACASPLFVHFFAVTSQTHFFFAVTVVVA